MREFNVEFERLVLRLREVRCELPPLVKAWLYVDKLRLSENEELALLASVGNEYDVRRLQQAAMIQDSSLRRGFGGGPGQHAGGGGDKRWQGGRFNKHSVHLTTHEEEVLSSDSDEPNDRGDGEQDLVEEGVAEAAHTAYMAYQGAKAKYREAVKGRGVDLGEMKKRNEERLRLAKQRSYCSACKRRGHWHRDPECPLGDAGKNGGAAASHEPSSHQVNMVHNVHSSFVASDLSRSRQEVSMEMLAILDTACTKSVAGYSWFEQYYKMADHLVVIEETDHFQFGASRVYVSDFAVRCWFAIGGKWFMAKVAIVQCPVPLLFSRPVLSQLGAFYDLAAQKVSLKALSLEDLDILSSSTGHPALMVSQFPEESPPTVEVPDFDDAWVPARVYMVAAAVSAIQHDPQQDLHGGDFKKLFYPKKIPLEVHNMLSSTSLLGAASFFSWWKHANQCNDFWIETADEMIRVHVAPRRSLFSPVKWKTANHSLKESLLSSLVGRRVTESISVLSEGTVIKNFQDTFRREKFVEPHVGLWIGRSRFDKCKIKPAFGPTAPTALQTSDASGGHCDFSMEDEEGRPVAGALRNGHPCSQFVDSPGAQDYGDGGQEGDSTSVKEGDGRDERAHQVQPGRAHQDSPGTGHLGPGEGDSWMVAEGDPGVKVDPCRDNCAPRQVQRVALSGSPDGLSRVGHQGGGGEPESPSRLGSLGKLGSGGDHTSSEGEGPNQESGSRPRGDGEDPSSVGGRPTWRNKLGFILEPSKWLRTTSSHSTLPFGQQRGGGQRQGGDCHAEDSSGDLGGQTGWEGPGRQDHGCEDGSASEEVIPEGAVEYELCGSETDDEDVGQPGEAAPTMSMSPRQRAVRGHFARKEMRKKMNRSTAAKIKDQAKLACQVFLCCSLAMASHAAETLAEPVSDIFAVFTPSDRLLPGGREEVQCLELFAGKGQDF